ncbi:hypothetical protein Tco_1567644 [Tanacetum coccineum]
MSNYLKHQGSWTSAQLKKLSNEEIKAKYETLSDTSKKQKTTKVKAVSVTEEPVKELTTPKQEEIKQLIKKLGRQKSMARKRKLVDYEILDQSSPIIAWNSEYYRPKSLHDEVEVPKEINMNVVTRLNRSKSWKLHKSSGVHSLKTVNTEMVIHMLVEKKYPLIKKVLLQMLELKLESEDDSTMALELIKFIKQQI